MIRIDRICIWLFLSALVLLLVSHKFLKPVDESITVFLLGIALADSILNNKWRSYIPLWILLGVTLVYIIYSLAGVHFNTARYILTDALIEIKPYLPFLVCLGISPKWSNVDLRLLQTCALLVAVITTGILLTGPSNTNMIFEHQSFAGLIIYICALCYWFGCITPDGQVTHRDKLIIILIMTGGLLCTRSKFYGYYVLGIFFMFFYRPGILKQINMKHLAMIVSLIIVFIAVSWKKISFYFITGNSDSFDPNVMESFARPVMYLHGFTILFDYFPFGSGLASFASFPSAENYSSLYYEYGLNNIGGLSPDMPDFICDAFYPTLAQFGIIGVILFITFWVYTYRFLRMMIRKNPILYINQFSIGALIISAMLIECVASTSFVQPSGQVAMMLLGMICSVSKSFSGDATIENATSTLTTDNKKKNQNIMEKATDNTLDIRRYWREMRRLRWVYILAFIAIVGLASILVVRSMKHCESSAMMLIEESTSDTGSGTSKGGGLMGMMKMFSVGGFGSSSVDNEIFLIRSHDMAVRTVKALGLTSTYIERDGLKKHLLFPNSPVKATMPQSVLDTLAFPFLIRVEISPDQHVNAKTMRGRLFWRTTFDEVKDATLPVNLDTPYGPVTLTAGDMSLLDGKKMEIDIVITGVKTAALKLEKNTSTDVVEKLADAIEITLSGGSDTYCNTVLAEYINQYNNRRIERRAENAMSELEFYDARIADLFSDLSESEEKLEKFKSENNLIGMDAQASMLVESTVGKTEAITVERAKQEYYRIVKSTLENPESANSLIPVVESLGNPMIAKYNELLLARKNLERSATGENPQLVALNDQIDELRTSILKNVDGMLAESRMQLEAMSGLMGTAQSRLNKMPAYEREYINLMRDRTMKNELYMFLLQKRENAALQVSSTSTLGFVIDPPHTPEKVSNIKNIILILVAIFLSFALPTFLAIFLVLWRNRVEDTSDLASMHIESRAVMASSDDTTSITGLRTQLLSTPEQTTVYVCNLADSDGNTIIGELTESLEHIGRQVNLINHLEDNDAILSPRFQPLLKSGAYNYIVMPDSSHISAYVDSFNADNATLLVIIKSGAMRRNALRSLLRGIYADKVVTAILR